MSMPPLKVEIKQEGRVCVLSIGGELDIATAPVLAAEAAPIRGAGAERLVVDLSGLEFIDCYGIRALAAVTQTAPPGCPVVVHGAGGRVRKVLDILGVRLERHGQEAVERASWLVLESAVLRSWAAQVRADTRILVASSRHDRAEQSRTRRRAIVSFG
jgi:anti-anti-sigma factor